MAGSRKHLFSSCMLIFARSTQSKPLNIKSQLQLSLESLLIIFFYCSNQTGSEFGIMKPIKTFFGASLHFLPQSHIFFNTLAAIAALNAFASHFSHLRKCLAGRTLHQIEHLFDWSLVTVRLSHQNHFLRVRLTQIKAKTKGTSGYINNTLTF